MSPELFYSKAAKHLSGAIFPPVLGKVGRLFVGACLMPEGSAAAGAVLLADATMNRNKALLIEAEVSRDDTEPWRGSPWSVSASVRRSQLDGLIGSIAAYSLAQSPEAVGASATGDLVVILTVNYPGDASGMPPTLNGIPLKNI